MCEETSEERMEDEDDKMMGREVDAAGHRAIGLIQAAAANIRDDDSLPEGMMFRMVNDMTGDELKLTCLWLATNAYRLIVAMGPSSGMTPEQIIEWMGMAVMEREAERDAL